MNINLKEDVFILNDEQLSFKFLVELRLPFEMCSETSDGAKWREKEASLRFSVPSVRCLSNH